MDPRCQQQKDGWIFLAGRHRSSCWVAWRACQRERLQDELQGCSAAGVGCNWFWEVFQHGTIEKSSGLQLLLMYLCERWVERASPGAFWLRCTSAGSQSDTLLAHFSSVSSGCLAVFQPDWLPGNLLFAICSKNYRKRFRFSPILHARKFPCLSLCCVYLLQLELIFTSIIVA